MHKESTNHLLMHCDESKGTMIRSIFSTSLVCSFDERVDIRHALKFCHDETMDNMNGGSFMPTLDNLASKRSF